MLKVKCIQSSTLQNIADNLRLALSSETGITLIPSVIQDEERLKPGAIVCKYRIFNNGESYVDHQEQYTHYEYGVHPVTGKTVPVFYETVGGERQPEYDDSFWYDGRVTYNNEVMDSWKAVSDQYTLEGPETQTLYTNVVTYIEGEAIPVTNFASLIAGLGNGGGSSSDNSLKYHKAFFNQDWATPLPTASYTWGADTILYNVNTLNSSAYLPAAWSSVASYDISNDWSITGTDAYNSSTWVLHARNYNPYYYLHIYMTIDDYSTVESQEGRYVHYIHLAIPPNSSIEKDIATVFESQDFDHWGSKDIQGVCYAS